MDVRFYLSYDSMITLKSHILFENFKILPNMRLLWIFLHNVMAHQFVMSLLFFLFDLIQYVPSTIFQLCRDGSSWVEPVLS